MANTRVALFPMGLNDVNFIPAEKEPMIGESKRKEWDQVWNNYLMGF